MRDKIQAWIRARNDCPESQIHLADAAGAARCGLHVLEQLLLLLHELEQAPISRAELIAIAELSDLIVALFTADTPEDDQP